MLGLLIYIGGLSMSFLEDKVKTALNNNYQHLKTFDPDILSAIECSILDDAREKTIEAVTLFNWALHHLDNKPAENNREQHVLVGDYLLSQFYKLVIEDAQLSVLNDMMEISKKLHIEKSKFLSDEHTLDERTLESLLFAPILYLVDRSFISSDVKRATALHVEQLMNSQTTLRLKEVL